MGVASNHPFGYEKVHSSPSIVDPPLKTHGHRQDTSLQGMPTELLCVWSLWHPARRTRRRRLPGLL